jgi:putative DNA primase/helicase
MLDHSQHIPPSAHAHAHARTKRVLETIPLSRITAKPLKPLWPGALYAGKVTVIAGIPGDGKSLLSQDIAARISVAGSWPCGAGTFRAERVVLLTAEDDPSDTIRPRLDVAGANTEFIELVQGVSTAEATGARVLDSVSLLRDLDALETRITELGASLFLIDPLTSFAGSDTNKTCEMRTLLDRLSQMAARTGVAVLVITHLNKRSDARKAMQLVAGSHVITAAVRVALVTARDPHDRHRRLLLPIKLNIAQDEGGFAFRVLSASHATCGDVPRVEWESDRVQNVSADEALIHITPRSRAGDEKAKEVQDWLRDRLLEEGLPADHLWEQTRAQGFSHRRVQAALKEIGAVCEAQGYPAKWYYSLPQSDTKHTEDRAHESDRDSPTL